MSRLIACWTTLCVIAIAPDALAQQPAAAKQIVTPPGQNPSWMLSAGVRVGDMLYVSGQLGMRRDAPDTTIEGQTRQALENTKRIVEAGGTSMANVVKCTVFLINAADFAPMNRVYREFFPAEPPARSTVVVAALVVPAAKVEIECMAAMPPTPR
jgi:2-iminobutanoate/2-iminopropanoate deaminase